MHLRSKTKESFKTIHMEIINDLKRQQQTITNVKSCYVKLTIKKIYNRITIKMNNRDCCSSRLVFVRINDSKNNWSRSNNVCIVTFNGYHFLLKYNIMEHTHK